MEPDQHICILTHILTLTFIINMCYHVLHLFISAIKCLKVNDKLYFFKHIFTAECSIDFHYETTRLHVQTSS